MGNVLSTKQVPPALPTGVMRPERDADNSPLYTAETMRGAAPPFPIFLRGISRSVKTQGQVLRSHLSESLYVSSQKRGLHEALH